jgi:hypothetical protein
MIMRILVHDGRIWISADRCQKGHTDIMSEGAMTGIGITDDRRVWAAP